MGCFENLVKSHFLANVSAELRLARRTVKSMGHTSLQPFLYVNKRNKKELYGDYIYQFYLTEEMQESPLEDDKSMIFFVQYETLAFIYSRSKAQIDESIQYSFNVHGQIPLGRAKHKINGFTVYTALIDTRFSFTPTSPN